MTERWSDQKPDATFLEALDHAGERPEDGEQSVKRRWSELFANSCAVWIAKHLAITELRTKRIRPLSLDEGTEPLTPIGKGVSKRIDVTVSDAVLGLELGVSLKGLNFRDSKSNNFDKNLTGRLYELGDEVRLVHEHLPHAYMVAVFFLPVESTHDKLKGRSSFAHAVTKLRERTGRLDPSIPSHQMRCDSSFVALYAHHGSSPEIKPGVIRFFNVEDPPPERGRPLIAATSDVGCFVQEIVRRATYAESIKWGEAEKD